MQKLRNVSTCFTKGQVWLLSNPKNKIIKGGTLRSLIMKLFKILVK